MNEIIIRIFRLDVKSDYEYCYKPYKIKTSEVNDDTTLFDVLNIIKKQDRYFSVLDKDEFVRIENKVLSLNEKISDLIKDFGDDFSVSPVDLRRAVLDLACDDEDFLDKFKYFKDLCDESDYELYKSYKFLYYASDARIYNKAFLGDSAFIFAKDLLDKYPNKKDEILNIIFNEDYGISYAVSLKPFLYRDYEKYENIKNELKHKKDFKCSL